MTDLDTYRALPASECERLGYAKWREEQRVSTHGPDCWMWGPKHYNCACRKINELLDAKQKADAARWKGGLD